MFGEADQDGRKGGGMGRAEEAFEEARRRIEVARMKGAVKLDLHSDLRLARLKRIPEEIAGLTGLMELDLSDTGVSDVTALAGLTGLMELDLSDTGVSDVTALAGLTGLTWLRLNGTGVSDVTVLAGLTGLTSLRLSGTEVSVAGLKSLRALERLVTAPDFGGLEFVGCAATLEDKRVAEVSRFKRPKQRARALFEYLGMGGVVEDEFDPPKDETQEEASAEPVVPDHAPAPLETEIVEQRLVRSTHDGSSLPPGEVNDRARKGWAVIATQRDDLVGQINLANYRPLASAIGALSRALGPTYEAMNEIGVGIAGQRLTALVQDAAFMETLPDGVGTEVAVLATTLGTFTNRFPEWLAYLEDATEGLPVAEVVQQEIAAFEALAKALEVGADVDRDVAEEYRDELEWVRSAPDSEVAAWGLLASTRELLRTLAENMIMGFRLYRSGVVDGVVGRRMAHEAKEFAKIAPTEIRKKAGWLVAGIAGDVLVLKGGLMLALARQFPERLGWVEGVLRFFGVI
jgi:hypothetical protein